VNYNDGDMAAMKEQVMALTTISPSRLDFLNVANAYAARVGDRDLQTKVFIQMQKAGIITFIDKSDTATTQKK
jgi:hypothetical protein